MLTTRRATLFFTAILAFPLGAGAQGLQRLAGSWDDLESYVTLGVCASAPMWAGMSLCHPAHLAGVKEGRFEGAAFVSATDSVLELSDSLRKEEIESEKIQKLLTDYNYSDLLISGRVSYTTRYWTLGIRPIRISGEFQAHNPSLLLGSLTYRDDMEFFLGAGYGFDISGLKIAFGSRANYLKRKEVLAEASLAEFASQPASELLSKSDITGVFFDIGGVAEIEKVASFSVLARDLIASYTGTDPSERYLFIRADRIPRVLYSLSFIPTPFIGTLQLGSEVVYYTDGFNDYGQQWVGTISYYVGPLRLVSGLRPGLLRTGLSMRFSRFEAAVAQEWINRLEDDRIAQPRFTLSISAGL